MQLQVFGDVTYVLKFVPLELDGMSIIELANDAVHRLYLCSQCMHMCVTVQGLLASGAISCSSVLNIALQARVL